MDRGWLADCQRHNSCPIRSDRCSCILRSCTLPWSEHQVRLTCYLHQPNCCARPRNCLFGAALPKLRTTTPNCVLSSMIINAKIRTRKYTTAPSVHECRTVFPMRSLCCCRFFPINRIDHTGGMAALEAAGFNFFVFLRHRLSDVRQRAIRRRPLCEGQSQLVFRGSLRREVRSRLRYRLAWSRK